METKTKKYLGRTIEITNPVFARWYRKLGKVQGYATRKLLDRAAREGYVVRPNLTDASSGKGHWFKVRFEDESNKRLHWTEVVHISEMKIVLGDKK